MKQKLFSVRELVFIALFAAVIAISAWIAIPAAIPFTLQTLSVFACTGILGLKCSLAATVTYILLGLVGLPVFAGFQGGIGVLLSVTGGYILGFIPAVLVCGILMQHFGKKMTGCIICMTLGLVTCYLFGSLWFFLLHKAAFLSALTSCVLPFIPFDIIKILLAAVITFKVRKHICLK